MRSLGALAVFALTAACAKPPTDAQLALQHFIDHAAEGRVHPEDLISNGEGRPTPNESETIQEGIAEYPLPISGGSIAWTRYKLISEQPLPEGDHELTVSANICATARVGGSCSRPNTYEYHALVRQTDEGWRVAGSTYRAVNIVR